MRPAKSQQPLSIQTAGARLPRNGLLGRPKDKNAEPAMSAGSACNVWWTMTALNRTYTAMMLDGGVLVRVVAEWVK